MTRLKNLLAHKQAGGADREQPPHPARTEYRGENGHGWFAVLRQDLRYAVRMLRANKVFALTSVLTIALGIGANTAIFSVVNAVLLRPLPYAESERLVTISETHPDIPRLEASVPDFLDWREQARSFEGMAAYTFGGYQDLVLTTNGEPEQLQGTLASQNLFSLLGVRPVVGRDFLPEEEQPGHDHVVILSHSLWQRRFASDPNVLGKALTLNGESFTVIGVMSGDEGFPSESDIWLPLSRLSSEDLTSRKYHPVAVVARLRPGVTLNEARPEMEEVARHLQQAYAATNKKIGVALAPLREQFVGNLQVALLVLLGAVGLVLLIACANVANLFLARAAARQKEVAVRLALGAGRGRLIRQFLTESLLLAFIGGAFGLLLAMWSLPLLRSSLLNLTEDKIPRLDQISIDPRVLVFTFVVSGLTGVLFGILPALQASRANPLGALNQEGRAAAGSVKSGARQRLIIILEVSLAVVVLSSAGLLIRTLQYLSQVDPGFPTDHLLTVQLSLPASKYAQPEQVSGFYEQLFRGIEALPGVKGVASVNAVPLRPSHAMTRFAVEGAGAPEAGQYPVALLRGVSPGYFQLMGIPLKRGRFITEDDLTNHDGPTFVINETMARLFFPGQEPVGKNILLGVLNPKPTPVRVVGVVADVKDSGLDAAVQPELYYANFDHQAVLLIRTTTEPLSLSPAIRRQVLAVDPEQPVSQTRSMEEIVAESLARRRFSAMLLGLFSLLALALTVVGIYAVMSYSVTQRTREIGIRMALGAQAGDIASLMLRQGGLPVVVGLVLGVVGACVLTRIMSGLLYGVSATDPTTFATVCILLLGVALLATYIPARRACRIDPLAALRAD